MKRNLIINNVFFGMILLAIWAYDFHYKRRYGKKIGRNIMDKYNNLNSDLEKKIKKEENNTDFIYRPKDIYYIDFYNFKEIEDSVFDEIEKNLDKIYLKNFKNIHTYQIYFREKKKKLDKTEDTLDKDLIRYSGINFEKKNFYHVSIIKDYFENKLFKKEESLAFRISKEKLKDPNFLKKFCAKIVHVFKNLNKLDLKNNNKNLSKKLKEKYLSNLYTRFSNYIKSVNFINKNKNLAFIDEYLNEINTDINNLEKEFLNNNLEEIYLKLRKQHFYIYISTYMYEDYYLAMLIATVLLIFSPLIRIATAEIRFYLFDFGTKIEEKDEENWLTKIYIYIIDN